MWSHISLSELGEDNLDEDRLRHVMLVKARLDWREGIR